MAPEFAEIATIIASILTVVISLQRRAIFSYLKKANAYGKDSAVRFEAQNALRLRILRKMLTCGEVVQVEDTYYLNEERNVELKTSEESGHSFWSPSYWLC